MARNKKILTSIFVSGMMTCCTRGTQNEDILKLIPETTTQFCGWQVTLNTATPVMIDMTNQFNPEKIVAVGLLNGTPSGTTLSTQPFVEAINPAVRFKSFSVATKTKAITVISGCSAIESSFTSSPSPLCDANGYYFGAGAAATIIGNYSDIRQMDLVITTGSLSNTIAGFALQITGTLTNGIGLIKTTYNGSPVDIIGTGRNLFSPSQALVASSNTISTGTTYTLKLEAVYKADCP